MFRYSIDTANTRAHLQKLVPVLKVRVFVFVGRRDHWVPPEPAKFNSMMVELVQPLASLPATGSGAATLPVSA